MRNSATQGEVVRRHFSLQPCRHGPSCSALFFFGVSMRLIKNHWYVSTEAPSVWRPATSRAPSSRGTRTFPNEIDAKQFAKAMLSEGMKVTAGTLNPHRPKRRLIAFPEIGQWIEEDT
jgi:hypothetical protein